MLSYFTFFLYYLQNPVCVLYLQHTSVQTGHVSRAKSPMWQVASVWSRADVQHRVCEWRWQGAWSGTRWSERRLEKGTRPVGEGP